MPWSIVSVRRAEERAGLGPAALQGRVATLVSQKAELVARGPAETSTEGQECLASMVHGGGPLIDWSVHAFPGLGRLREDLSGAKRGGRVHRRDAQ